MASKLIKGKDVILSIYDEEGSAYKPVACLTGNDYTVSVDVSDGDANKCDDTVPRDVNGATYELSGDGQVLSDSDDNYTDKANSEFLDKLVWKKENINWKMDGGYDTKYGEGIITDYSEDYPADGNATFSITISGVGKPTDEDPKS